MVALDQESCPVCILLSSLLQHTSISKKKTASSKSLRTAHTHGAAIEFPDDAYGTAVCRLYTHTHTATLHTMYDDDDAFVTDWTGTKNETIATVHIERVLNWWENVEHIINSYGFDNMEHNVISHCALLLNRTTHNHSYEEPIFLLFFVFLLFAHLFLLCVACIRLLRDDAQYAIIQINFLLLVSLQLFVTDPMKNEY